MSVHSEYGRTLENVLAAVEMLEPERGEPHRAALERARLGAQPDLESAARAALEALEGLAGIAVAGERLTEVADHLDAHCRVILGLSRVSD